MTTRRLKANVVIKKRTDAQLLAGGLLEGELGYADPDLGGSGKLYIGDASGSAEEVHSISDLTWDDITGKPSIFPPSAHTHAESEVTGLISDLATLAGLISAEATARDAAIAALGALLLETTATLEFDSIESRKTITADNTYMGSVGLVSTGGANLLLAYFKGTAHTSPTDLGYKTSTDLGATWSAESKHTPYYIGPFPWNLHRMPGGNIMASGSVDNGGSAASGYVYSSDNGATWSAPVIFETVFGNRGFRLGSDAYVAGYKNSLVGTGSGAFLYKSSDDGVTWSKVSEIRKVGEPQLTETGICYLGNNTILAISRDNFQTNTYKHISHDLGATWDDVVDITSQVSVLDLPQVLNLGTCLLMVARDSLLSALVMFLSYDQGATWSSKITLDSYALPNISAIDGGYSCPRVIDSTHVLVPYYAAARYAQVHSTDIKSLVVKFRGGAITDSAT
jgi:hypothetical protein